MENITINNNTQQLRFEVDLNGEFAYLEYRYYKKDIAFMHTVVPDDMQGQGIAAQMAVAALDFARKEKKKILLYCPYVSKYVKEHPEYQDLVDREYHPDF